MHHVGSYRMLDVFPVARHLVDKRTSLQLLLVYKLQLEENFVSPQLLA